MDNNRSNSPKTYNIQISLIHITWPKYITNQATITIISIMLGLPLSLFLWTHFLDHLLNLANSTVLINPSSIAILDDL